MEQIQRAVHELAADVAETKESQAQTETHIGWIRAAIDRIEVAIKPIESVERRVTLLERAMFGLIGVVMVAVVTAWIQGILPGSRPTP